MAPLFAEVGVAELLDGAIGHRDVALFFVLALGPGDVGGVRDFGAFTREGDAIDDEVAVAGEEHLQGGVGIGWAGIEV